MQTGCAAHPTHPFSLQVWPKRAPKAKRDFKVTAPAHHASKGSPPLLKADASSGKSALGGVGS